MNINLQILLIGLLKFHNMKQQRGGKREGAGRPKNIPTKILTIRVAAAIHDELKAIVKRMDDEYRQNE